MISDFYQIMNSNISTLEFADVQLAINRFINVMASIFPNRERSAKPIVYMQQGNTSSFARSRIYTQFGRIYRSGIGTSHAFVEYALKSGGYTNEVVKYATIGWDFENNCLIVSEEDENYSVQTYGRMNRLLFIEDNKVLKEQLDLEAEISDIRKKYLK